RKRFSDRAPPIRAGKAVTAIGSNATAVQGDTSNPDDLDRIYATIKAKAGHIDVLAVNAGYYEFGRFGEITNVLSPGHVETPGLSHLMTAEQKAEAVALVPLGRIGTPDDLGKAAVFLASEGSAYITGVELFVDGGVAQI